MTALETEKVTMLLYYLGGLAIILLLLWIVSRRLTPADAPMVAIGMYGEEVLLHSPDANTGPGDHGQHLWSCARNCAYHPDGPAGDFRCVECGPPRQVLVETQPAHANQR